MKKLFLTSLKNITFYLGLSVFIGLIVGAYQLGITFFKDSSNFLYNSRSIVIIILTILLGIVLAILNDLILRFNPHINGSAIPYIELAIRENKKIDYKKGIVTIVLNSFISTLAGFTLGSEGPSICLGGMSGSLFSDLFKRDKDINEDLYIASGAGFACAFLSPLSGICYIYEEFIHKVNIKNLIKAIFVTFISVLITYLINKHHLLSISNLNILPLNVGYVYIFLFISNLIIGYLFIKLIILIRKFFNKFKNNKFIKYRSYFFFAIILVLNYLCLEYMGSGLNIMSNVSTYTSIILVILILVFRFIITIFSGNAKVTGGLVVPIMCLGSLSGQLICLIGSKYFNLDPSYFTFIILVSSCMLFGIITKVPLTASSLVISTIFSCTFNFIYVLKVLPIVLILFISSSLFARKILKLDCIYEEMILADNLEK